MNALLVTVLLLASARAVDEVAVSEHLGERVPVALVGEGETPVLLVLAYARCALLCNVVLESVASAAAGMALEPGRDYRLVIVSIDPDEKPGDQEARLARKIGRGTLRYVTGHAAEVRALAATLGFRYARDPATGQIAHPAVIFVLTPDGRIARYLYGVQFPPAVVATALRLAQRGILQPTEVAQLADGLLRCFRYEPGGRRYGAYLRTYFRAGALLVFVMVAGLVGGLVARERRRRA
jgi:protein SCO1